MKQRIPLHIPGGIGDMILALPVIEAIRMRVQDDESFLFYANYPELLSHFLPWAKDIRSRFKFSGELATLPWWLELIDVPIFRIRPNVKELPLPIKIIYAVYKYHLPIWSRMIASHPGSSILLGRQALKLGFNRRTLCASLLGLETKPFEYSCEGFDSDFYITVHDGTDINEKLPKGFSMKNWTLEHWAELILKLKQDFCDIPIVQLGSARSRKIPGADHSLVGKTTFPETMQYLKSAIIHVDGDSGLVHARALFGKQSVVLFGPTEKDYFAYPENENIGSPFCAPCWWITQDWLTNCYLGHEVPLCMKSIEPEVVRAAVHRIIEKKTYDTV